MNIDKSILHSLIEKQISQLLEATKLAASQAYETATHEENKAENKYDTLGLEAAYLAEGQSKRVTDLENNLAIFKSLGLKHYDNNMDIGLGALVCLTSKTAENKYLFISPVCGGTIIQYQSISIMLITPSSPLGMSLKKSYIGDALQLNSTTYGIAEIW